MIVEQVWTANAYRNFNYLVACEETGEALAIDPLDYRRCLAVAKHHGWEIRQVLNTHEHGDHTGGNRGMIAATGARLLAHRDAAIDGVQRGLVAGNAVRIGKTVELEALDTPGHTMSHVCLLAHADRPALFCGDTLFNAGAGNCHNGGHPEALYTTFSGQLAKLADETLVYPGHDYLANNLAFTMDREPHNETAGKMLAQAREQDPDNALVTTLGLEKQINVFFRLHNPEVVERLRENFPGLGNDERDIFLRLRELRNAW